MHICESISSSGYRAWRKPFLQLFKPPKSWYLHMLVSICRVWLRHNDALSRLVHASINLPSACIGSHERESPIIVPAWRATFSTPDVDASRYKEQTALVTHVHLGLVFNLQFEKVIFLRRINWLEHRGWDAILVVGSLGKVGHHPILLKGFLFRIESRAGRTC